MVTDSKEPQKGIIIPECAYKNRDHFACNDKRYHILFIEQGSGSITYGGHKELFMGPLVFCFHENEIPQITNGSNIESRSIYFSPEYINNKFTYDNLRNNSEQFTITDIRDRNWFQVFFERTEHDYGRINLSMATAKRMTQLFNHLAEQLENQPDWYWPCRGRSFLLEILFLVEQCRFMKDQNQSMFTSGYSEELEKVILYLYSNYGKKITVPELVKEFNIDRTTLTKKFNEEVGDSVIHCLIQIRINLASSMLRDTLIPISEIMFRVGFTDAAHFNRTFKKYTKFNPSEYRNNYNILLH
jgi:AraC family L-rhamnose operon regulatory protein RhaS